MQYEKVLSSYTVKVVREVYGVLMSESHLPQLSGLITGIHVIRPTILN
jgi:hypothetical protein